MAYAKNVRLFTRVRTYVYVLLFSSRGGILQCVDAACFIPCYCCRRRLKRRDGHGQLGRGRTEKCPMAGGKVGVNVFTTINGLSTGREQAPGRLFFKKSRHLVRGLRGNSGGLVLTRWSLRTARARHVRMAENIDETTGCSFLTGGRLGGFKSLPSTTHIFVRHKRLKSSTSVRRVTNRCSGKKRKSN